MACLDEYKTSRNTMVIYKSPLNSVYADSGVQNLSVCISLRSRSGLLIPVLTITSIPSTMNAFGDQVLSNSLSMFP